MSEEHNDKTVGDESILTLDSIFSSKKFRDETYSQPRWWKEGSHYTTLDKVTDNKNGTNKVCDKARDAKKKIEDVSNAKPATRDLIWNDPSTGKSHTYVSADQLIPAGSEEPLTIEDYAFSPDRSRLLIFTNAKKVWRKKTRGDYWVLDITGRELRQLGGNDVKSSSLMFATFSPDSQKVCFVHENNIYVQDLHSFGITALTTDGSETIINGTFDWVYEEEFSLRRGFRWSPDSKSIAFWQIDQSGVRIVNLINNADYLYPKLVPIPYPKTGEKNSACRVGVIDVSGDESPRWLEVPGDPRNNYIADVDWIESSGELVLQQLNRLQNTVHVMIANPSADTSVKTIFTDRDEAWLDHQANIKWLGGGLRFLWLSERNGWRQLFLVEKSGNCEPKPLTAPTFDVTKVAGVDEPGGWVYYCASPDDPLRRYLFRTKLDGSCKAERISPGDMPGTHGYMLSNDAKFAIHTYSNFGSPDTTRIVSLPDHKVCSTLADNTKLRQRVLTIPSLSKTEFNRIDIGEGVEVDYYCIKPPTFDPAKKYPVLFFVYGEPAMQTVRDMWGGRTSLWHHMLAQRGYIILCVDNRGTPAPRGRAWRKVIYRQIGILASSDQAAALRALLSAHTYLDSSRIAIWGWSGGGSMSLNAIFRYPDLYHTAMVVAPVPNQRHYDTIYQERYMGLPRTNVEGYRDGSPITFAKNLRGNLLLVHGTGDDNCHYAGMEALIDELIKRNKPFSMMAYPNRSHSISEGQHTTRHLFGTLTDFLERNVRSNPDIN